MKKFLNNSKLIISWFLFGLILMAIVEHFELNYKIKIFFSFFYISIFLLVEFNHRFLKN